jgi:hypothetical protein
MCDLYFKSGKTAKESVDILEALRPTAITTISTIYPRNREAIQDAKRLLQKNSDLLKLLEGVNLDPRFAARELLSHVLYEIFLEDGLKGVIKYLEEEAIGPNEFLMLLASVILNRTRLLARVQSEIAIYEQTWYPFLARVSDLVDVEGTSSPEGDSDNFRVEHFRYKLFEALLLPLFGRCDSRKKATKAAALLENKREETEALKSECKEIAMQVVLLPTKDEQLKQDRLNELIKQRVSAPLTELVEKPKRRIIELLQNICLDSTVIAGLLTIIQGFSPLVVGSSLAAGGISGGMRYFLSSRAQKSVTPPALLVEGLRESTVEIEDIQQYLSNIQISQLTLPENLGKEKLPNKRIDSDKQ